MELHTHKPGMVGKLHHLRQIFGWCTRTDDQTGRFQPWNIYVIDLVTMAVTLIDLITVNFMRTSIGFDRATL